MHAVPPVGAPVDSVDNPPTLPLRFPVGTRVDILLFIDEADEKGCRWRGTVVSHWHKSWSNRIAGEWCAYQVKMDSARFEPGDGSSHLVEDGSNSLANVPSDDDGWIVGAAAPESPHRRVRRLRDSVVTDDKDFLVEAADTEEEVVVKRCTHCGKCWHKNKVCRGCLTSVFYDARCQGDGWAAHKEACRAAAKGDKVTVRTLVAAASYAAIPTSAQIANSCRCLFNAGLDPQTMSKQDLMIQLGLDLGICTSEANYAMLMETVLEPALLMTLPGNSCSHGSENSGIFGG